uniref:UDENN domain-containing protein n=1 Tax=Amphiprion ocellaris TaxID=80972 RepID=A0AAQ5Z6D1_AMPOC
PASENEVVIGFILDVCVCLKRCVSFSVLVSQEVLQTIPKFCFPFDVERVSQNQVGQNFTFVLTDIDSKQRFGFCRLTQGCRVCICLLSYLPWFEIYYKLLNTLADYLGKQQENDLNDMLNSLYDLPVPKPFTPVNLSVVGIDLIFPLVRVCSIDTLLQASCARTVCYIPENPSVPVYLQRNLTEYFVAVDINNMLQLYASMLHERRIIITSSKLSTLTACVHGAAALLFPMYWQHIFIPVLPPHLLDYCCAPMPYFVGVHLSLLERVRSRSLEDVVILNVDTNTLESPFDDLHNLPSDVVSSLKSKLKKQSTATGSGVARAFLRAQAALFGSYRDALRYKPGEPITFCEESFVNHRSSTMKNFLSMAVNLQLFKQFIDGRLAKLNAGRGFTDVFEEEITEGGFCGSNSRSYQQWMHTVKVFTGCLVYHSFYQWSFFFCFIYQISSEDSGDVPSYTEDSDDSYSLELDIDSSRSGQMNLLEEILDSLNTTTIEQGKLSAAKSLDFFRSMDDLDYTAPVYASSGGDQGGWNMGQDDSAVHGKHLPPSPRRQPSKSSLKVSKTPATVPAVPTITAMPPSQDADVSKSHPHQSSPSKSGPDPHPPPPGRQPENRFSYSPSMSHRVTPMPPSPTLSHTYSSPVFHPNYSPLPAGRSRTISDPQAGSEPCQVQNQTASTSILRRKVLSKETVRNYQEKALQRQGSKGQHEGQRSPSRNSRSTMQVQWEKDVSKDGLLGLGLCMGQGKGSGAAVVQDQGLLEEIESMCCLGPVLHTSLQLSQVHCNNSHHQVQGKATDES